jgi:CBS domain-containing protein
MSDRDSVNEIMSKTVRTLETSGTIGHALETMADFDIGSLVVVEDNKPVGIITERDFARRYANGKEASMEWKIGDIASKPLVSVTPETKVWDALDLMVRKKIRQLPVLKGGELVGIVTERDIFKWVIKIIHSPNIPSDLKKLVAQNM